MGGSILVTLSFVTILYPLTVLLSLYSPQDYFLVTIWELLLIMETEQGSNGHTELQPLLLSSVSPSTWASILVAAFPVKCRVKEVRSLIVSGSMNPFSFLLHRPLL